MYVKSLETLGFSFILGMNGVRTLGGVTINENGEVTFGVENVYAAAGTAVPTFD